MTRHASVIPHPPPGVAWTEGVARRGGMDLRWAIGRPAAETAPPVLLMNGRTECVEKYAEVIAELIGRGRVVASFDWRGQGRSGREAAADVGHVRDYQDYLDDLAHLLDGPFADLPRPFDVIGHSMGGHLALRWALKNGEQVRTLTLSAPMLDLAFRGPIRKLGRAWITTACLMGLSRRTAFKHGHTKTDAAAAAWFPKNPLTHDRARFDAWTGFLVDNPDVRLDAGSFGWLRATFASIDALKAETPARMPFPTLLFVGDQERVVDGEAIRSFGSENARVVRLANCRHEPLVETDDVRAAVWAENA